MSNDVIVYDYFTGEANVIKPDYNVNFSLNELEFKYLLMKGFDAKTEVIGLSEIFVMPKGLEKLENTYRVLDQGTVALYSPGGSS
ncbi:hypothetical protein HS7_12000 [Sulfolobales archaeon HS-7]|nr:hypothetical protein HS7_12000 [Sulfolobales archaeon HS-7]